MMTDAVEILAEISKQVEVCENCKLHFSRKRSVPGEGPANAEILFIGEGPGFYENEQGRPFVGQAGKFLDELLTTAGYDRSSVFITNVVKCRPPENRDPELDELTACAVYLDEQIETINPHVIVTLGRISMGKFLPAARISAVHGKPFKVNDRLVVPMFHPAAALHQPSLKTTIIADFAALPKVIEGAKQEKSKTNISLQVEIETPQVVKPEDPPAEQLSLF
jgi:uracil-DNA glycosylase family 4